MFNILDFGAVDDGKTMNTAAIQAAVDKASEVHGTVCVPEGVFLSGTIVLRGASLHLCAGAVLKASGDLADYPYQDYHHNEMGQLRAFLVNLGHDNVVIDGEGTIDLNGHTFYDMDDWHVPDSCVPFTEEQVHECTHPISQRPAQCIFFYQSKNIRLSGVRIIDAPCWTLTFAECENVKLQGLSIDTDLTIPNDDGIHLSASRDILISDCHISSGDDCIALSCITNWTKPCENVVITNCILRSCSKAIVIGYQYSIVRNVLISNCIIQESNRGLCLMCNDECGLIENVRVSNMSIDTRIRAGNWWGNGEPILMMAVKHDQCIPEDQHPGTVADCAIRSVFIDGVTCYGENAMGICGADGNIRNVALRNIDFTRKASINLPLKGETLDLSPSAIRPDVAADCGLYISGGAQVTLQDVALHGCRLIECP